MNASISKLLEEHFDTAFAAPDGITKLRDLILSLALQGKLVQQDPNDSPASELLKGIETEKKYLVKAGKIKKTKPLPKVQEADVLYALPDSWIWTRLGNIGNIFNGNSINAREKQSKYAGVSGLPYIATKDVSYGFEPLDYKNGINIPETEPKFKVAHKGAVLICSEGGSAGKKCGITEEDICFGNKLYANEPFGGITSRFILYLYLSPVFRQSFSAAMTGIIGGVSMAKFLALPIPLPPLEEQQRIVAKVDQLMARCDALEKLRKEREEKRLAVHAAAIKKLLDTPDGSAWSFIQQHFGELYTVKVNVAELRKAILQLAVMGRLVPQNPNDPPASELLKEIEAEKQRLVKVGKIKKPKPLPPIKPEETPYKLPQGWEWVRLGALTEVITKGSSPKWQGVDYVNPGEGILFITSENVGSFNLLLSKKKYVEEKFNEIEPRSILCKRDILMNIVGASIGRTAIFDLNETANINQAVTIIRLLSNLDHEYFLKFFNSQVCMNYMFDKQVDNARPNLSMGNITLFNIPLPPLPEQQRIVARIDQLMALCDTLDQQIDASTDKQTELLNAVMAQV